MSLDSMTEKDFRKAGNNPTTAEAPKPSYEQLAAAYGQARQRHNNVLRFINIGAAQLGQHVGETTPEAVTERDWFQNKVKQLSTSGKSDRPAIQEVIAKAMTDERKTRGAMLDQELPFREAQVDHFATLAGSPVRPERLLEECAKRRTAQRASLDDPAYLEMNRRLSTGETLDLIEQSAQRQKQDISIAQRIVASPNEIQAFANGRTVAIDDDLARFISARFPNQRMTGDGIISWARAEAAKVQMWDTIDTARARISQIPADRAKLESEIKADHKQRSQAQLTNLRKRFFGR